MASKPLHYWNKSEYKQESKGMLELLTYICVFPTHFYFQNSISDVLWILYYEIPTLKGGGDLPRFVSESQIELSNSLHL